MSCATPQGGVNDARDGALERLPGMTLHESIGRVERTQRVAEQSEDTVNEHVWMSGFMTKAGMVFLRASGRTAWDEAASRCSDACTRFKVRLHC